MDKVSSIKYGVVLKFGTMETDMNHDVRVLEIPSIMLVQPPRVREIIEDFPEGNIKGLPIISRWLPLHGKP